MALDPWLGKPPHPAPIDLPGYSLDLQVRLDLSHAAVIGLILIPLWWVAFVLLTSALGETAGLSGEINLLGVLLALPVSAGVLAGHELVHGLAALLTGNRPAFGVGPGFAYTTVHAPLTKAQYLTIVLAPSLVLNAAAIAVAVAWPALAGWALFASLVNSSGAGGDLWMAARVAPLPAEAKLVDLADGYAVYLPATGPG